MEVTIPDLREITVTFVVSLDGLPADKRVEHLMAYRAQLLEAQMIISKFQEAYMKLLPDQRDHPLSTANASTAHAGSAYAS